MITTIDSAGRVVIPKAIREQAGLQVGAEIEIQLDGSGVHIQAIAGRDLRRSGRFVTIPASGQVIDDALIDRLRREGQR